MAYITETLGTFNTPPVGVKIRMDEELIQLPIDTIPLQKEVLTYEATNNIRNDWMHDELDRQEYGVAAASTTGETTVTLTDATGVRPNDVLMRKDGTVLLHVTAVNYTTGVITVARPFAGSTDEALSTTDKLVLIGQVPNEGADPEDPRALNRTGDYNVTQIFQEAIEATRTARQNEQYGVQDPFSFELNKKMREIAMRCERAYLFGRRYVSPDAKKRMMGGLFYFVTTDYSGTKENMTTLLGDGLQAAKEKGATPTVLLCSYAFKREFSQVNADRIMEARTERTVGQTRTVFESDFGQLTLIPHPDFPRKKAMAIAPEYIRGLEFQPLMFEMLAKTGDADKGELVAEKSLKVKHPEIMFTVTLTDL